MNKTFLYIICTSIYAGNCFSEMNSPVVKPQDSFVNQELELIRIMAKEGLSEQKLSNNLSLEDVQKLKMILSKFLHRKDLDSNFALKIIPQYIGLCILTAQSSKDLNELIDEIDQLILINPSISDELRTLKEGYFSQGCQDLFDKSQGLRDQLKREVEVTPQSISAEKKNKLEAENKEIYESIRKNKAIISITNPTQAEYIRRRDTLAPFLSRKDFEQETILDLIKQYNLCVIPAAKTSADIEEAKQKLEQVAQNYPKLATLIKSIIQLNYSQNNKNISK